MKTTPDPLQDPRFADLVSSLRAQPGPEPAVDFTARTLARLRSPAARRMIFPGRAACAAAALALLLGAGVWWFRTPVVVSRVPAPVDILMAAQRHDGSWPAEAQHDHSRYDISVTALALLALMTSEEAPLQGPHAAAIRAGLTHLLRQQDADGRFGKEFTGSQFTQYLAGLAVQTAARLSGAEPAWIMAAARAAPHQPTGQQMAKLNRNLARPEVFPPRWVDAGGPVTAAALKMLGR